MSEKKLQENKQNKPIIIDFATLSRLILKDLERTSTNSTAISKFSKENIARFLKDPAKNEAKLREVSRYLYNASPHYRRLINYFSDLLTFYYVVEPYGINLNKVNIDQFKKQYQRTVDFLEIMNVRHEFSKIMKTVFKEDIFYGYEHMAKDSYFIQKLNPDYCKISSIEDGVYNFAFDFSFFDKAGNKFKLESYPDEFRVKYQQYKKDKEKWKELDSNNTICIKVNEEIEYPIPPFNTVFESVFDIEDYKNLKKTKTKIDNYAVLTHRIPINENSDEANSFRIDLDTAIAFHNKASQALPDEVGLITSPLPIEVIKFDKDKVDNDKVAQAERDYYNSTGVSQFLFNSDKAGNTALNKSIVTDEEIAFSVLRQFERWVNRKLKTINTTYKFKVNFLDITVFNSSDVFEKYLKAAQYGMPVKNMVAASLGLSPSSMINMTFLENEVMGLHDKLIPLSSSHTQSGNRDKDDSGRPNLNEDELSDEGEKTRENEGNIRE